MADGSTISFGGLATGLDTKTIIAQLMAVEQIPLNKLTAQKTANNQLLTIYSDAQTKLAAIQTAAAALNTAAGFRKIAATSGDEDLFTVSADSTASAGQHTFKVNRLAQAEMDVSQGYASASADVGQGTFSFTLDGQAAFSVTTTSDMTLGGLRDAINAAHAGVTASLINDGDPSNPYRLVLTANDTGKAIAFTSNFTGGTPLAFTNGSNPGDPGQQARTAEVVLDGITIQKKSNTITDLMDGVTINLKKADSTTTTSLALASNAKDIGTQIQAFVDAFNAFHNWVASEKSSGNLGNDSTIESFDRSLRSRLSDSIPGLTGTYTNVAQAGLTFTRDGILQFDESKFETAVGADFDGVMKMFIASGTTSGSDVSVRTIGGKVQAGTYSYAVTGVGSSFAATINGHAATTAGGAYFTGAKGQPEEGLTLQFTGTAPTTGTVSVTLGLMETINRQIASYTDSSDGQIAMRKNAIGDDNRTLDDRIAQKQAWLDKEQQRLTAQFSAMEQLVSQMQSTSSYLTALAAQNAKSS